MHAEPDTRNGDERNKSERYLVMKKGKTIRFLGIPIYKSREKNGIRKKYFLGICYNKKKHRYINRATFRLIKRRGRKNK